MAGRLQQRRVTVHFERRFDEQIAQRGVQVGMRQQFDGRCEHVDRRGRKIQAQVKRAGRHYEFAQIGEAAHIGIGLGEIE